MYAVDDLRHRTAVVNLRLAAVYAVAVMIAIELLQLTLIAAHMLKASISSSR